MRLDRYTSIDGVLLAESAFAHRPTSDWCVLPAKHTTALVEPVELAASQHRVDDPKPPPTGADLARRKRFH